MADVVKLDGEKFTRDEAAMLYHASFYLTNEEQPLPEGQPPTPAMLAQMKLASALGEEVPEAALQNVQRSIDSARARAQRMAQQRDLANAARRRESPRPESPRPDPVSAARREPPKPGP